MPLNLIPIDIPPGVNSDDTVFASSPAWADASNVRFRLGRAQTIGGWESLTLSLLKGVCRAVLNWTENNTNTLDIAFGLHNGLQVWQGGALGDVTPTLALPAATLGADPLSCTAGSAVYTVTQTNHGYQAGETVTISGAAGCGRQVLGGGYVVANPTTNSFQVTAAANAVLGKTLGAGPLSVTSGSVTVTVTDTAHNIEPGAQVTISGAAAVGGITPNGTFAITVVDANTYSFSFTSPATSTTTGGGSAVVATPPATGGGSTLVVQNQRAWSGGAIDGAGSAGYGTGAYGKGPYGQPSAVDYFALTWSLAPWGQKLLASPRNQTIHAWSNALGTPAAPVLNAPQQVTYMLVAPQRQVFALGCNQEAGGVFNPLAIRHSGVGDETQWSTIVSSASTAREYVLPGGGRIVAGRVVGRSLLVWTNHAVWLGTYVGQVNQIWRFDKVGDKCGLIGPNAAVVVGSSAYWMSPDRQFHSYTLGGAVQTIACPIRKDMADNIAASQADKIVASSIAEFNEVWFFYPDKRDGYENSRYLACAIDGPDAGAWFRGQLARTAACDAGPSPYAIGVTLGGNVYWHEKGASADGGPLSWYVQTADMYLDENFSMLVRKYLPDLSGDQLGAVNLTVTTTMAPEDPAPRSFGPYVIPKGTREVDMLAEGRLFNLTFSGASYPSYMRLGRLLFDAKQRGRR